MTMNRRDLAKALGLAGASLFLPNLRVARAASGPPKRFVIFYSQHGTMPWLWRPQGSGTNFTLGPLLSPLAPYKQDLILLDGIDFKGLKGPGSKDDLSCGHARGQSSSLTANIQTQGATAKAGGPSIDYYIADGLKAANGGKPPTAVPLVQAAIVEQRPNVQTWGQPYQSAAGQTVLPERDALTVYKRLFPNGTPPTGGSPSMPDKETLQRKATLEYLEKEYKVVEQKLGKFERQRLDQHVTLVTDLKQRIDLMSGGGGAGGPLSACKAPMGVKANKVQSNYYDPLIWENTRPTVPLLMQAAFACDITRIFAIHVEDPPGRLYGGTAGFASPHEMVHGLDVGSKSGPVDQATKMYGEFTKIYKEVLDLLSAVKESDGKSLLYHTCVLWCGELAQPGHSTANAKWLTAGQLGGYLKTGQALSYDGDGVRFADGDKGDAVPSNGDVFTTIANGMGVPTKAFGVNTKGELAAMKA
ncbi:MAG: DUF1552 domain-containing protein [Deltaproteobacteria bacterium]|nr:DUF1552 domain-containing protein [Deltaproteobacteria bacterium]